MSPQTTPPEPRPGTVALVTSPSCVRLVLGGELDLLSKTELLDAVREALMHDAPVEVDTRAVTFMDSTVIATLSRLVNASRHRLTFVEPAPVVRFLLEVTGIGGIVDIVDDAGAPSDAADGGLPAQPSDDTLEPSAPGRESEAS
ncbi:MAG TPA: STAS domain-containing protein [Phototrophicaceae bacterium]|nr:STAS domain-containing protein [Phototrophicaceae bacterium]